ncbi:MAG: radical SAM protein [Polyangiaceae bacterium]
MSFRDLVARTWEENILFSVLVELTYRCNLDCAFCYNDLALAGTPLSKEQYLRFFDDLREMQVVNLTLTGGEPLAHPDFFALGRAARERGFVVRVKSNGHALRGDVARRLKEEVDPLLVEVSLHGATASTHDRQTRVPGSFDRLLSNLHGLRDMGQAFKINSTLTAWNESEIEAMFAIADDLGAPLQIDPEVTPKDDGSQDPLELLASLEGVTRLLEIQQARAAQFLAANAEALREEERPNRPAPTVSKKYCGAGSSSICIDPFGNVLPCVQWRRPVGNLHHASVKDLWSGNGKLDAIRGITTDVKSMIEAEPGGRTMSFCPGTAENHTGDPKRFYRTAETRRIAAGAADERKRRLPVVG